MNEFRTKNGITKKEEDILLDLYSRNRHFMTPGAKRAFNQIRVGYVLLAIGTIIGIWAVTNGVNENIRHDINQIGVAGCLSSIPTLQKYNDGIQAQIDTYKEARALNLARGDRARAKLNNRAIRRLNHDKVHVPTRQECQKNIIKE